MAVFSFIYQSWNFEVLSWFPINHYMINRNVRFSVAGYIFSLQNTVLILEICYYIG